VQKRLSSTGRVYRTLLMAVTDLLQCDVFVACISVTTGRHGICRLLDQALVEAFRRGRVVAGDVAAVSLPRAPAAGWRVGHSIVDRVSATWPDHRATDEHQSNEQRRHDPAPSLQARECPGRGRARPRGAPTGVQHACLSVYVFPDASEPCIF
jgi:hypothetical protein